MTSPEDNLLLFSSTKNDRNGWLTNPSYNFDSAAGIIYTVDVTQPEGRRIQIISMANGKPFYPDERYKVAVNSYRGNGGGRILTSGAGIPHNELSGRILTSTDKDMRYLLIQYIRSKNVISPASLNQWKFIPEKWTVPAAKRDSIRLFENN